MGDPDHAGSAWYSRQALINRAMRQIDLSRASERALRPTNPAAAFPRLPGLARCCEGVAVEMGAVYRSIRGR
jgi:hypothetical protein